MARNNLRLTQFYGPIRPMIIHTLPALTDLCIKLRAEKPAQKIIATNGCFDLVHGGHVDYLCRLGYAANSRLIVGLNSDASVAALKPGRPIMPEEHRAKIISAFWFVTAVYVFDSQTCEEFLSAVRPDVWAKGGDYTLDSLAPAEVAAVRQHGGVIELVPLSGGLSTTAIVAKIKALP